VEAIGNPPEPLLPDRGSTLEPRTCPSAELTAKPSAHANLPGETPSGRFAMMPVLDRDGRFSVDGFLTRESGPIRLDPPATELPAHYMGIRSGDRINLTFRLIGDGAVGGPIELRLGQTPRLRKCL
jgi:hypothetical protein